jgi:hypothetical protein
MLGAAVLGCSVAFHMGTPSHNSAVKAPQRVVAVHVLPATLTTRVRVTALTRALPSNGAPGSCASKLGVVIQADPADFSSAPADYTPQARGPPPTLARFVELGR